MSESGARGGRLFNTAAVSLLSDSVRVNCPGKMSSRGVECHVL